MKVTKVIYTFIHIINCSQLDVTCGKPARRRYCMHGCKVQSAPTTTVSCISSHAYSYIQQSGRSVKIMNAKKSTIHENVDAILMTVTSAVLGVGCHTRGHTASHIVSSIIVRCCLRGSPTLCILHTTVHRTHITRHQVCEKKSLPGCINLADQVLTLPSLAGQCRRIPSSLRHPCAAK